MKQKKNGKNVFPLLFIALSLTLAGCANTNSSGTDSSSNNTESSNNGSSDNSSSSASSEGSMHSILIEITNCQKTALFNF